MSHKSKKGKRISAKIRKVMKDDPSLTLSQALGKAFGILRVTNVRVIKRKKRKFLAADEHRYFLEE